ncbi:MAG: polymer-forming cytoskeletal protein [Ottowia sp.]|nr:polymer-forming cytoskeletal protein [Ottowia sp.]
MFFKRKLPMIDSLLGAGTCFNGDLKFDVGLRLEGAVKGRLNGAQPSMLIISEHATVEGEVRGDHVVISGRVVGPVYAASILELLPQAQIVGDIMYGMLKIHSGAEVTGQLLPLKNGATAPLLASPKRPDPKAVEDKA